MAKTQDRLAISRLINRFGFGPKPGEYAALLAMGLPAAQSKLLTPPTTDAGLSTITEPDFPDRGPFPTAGTPARTAFAAAMQSDRLNLELWWLDRMVLADHALTERLTWFWHGHWATSMGKVEYARPMKMQNDTLRANALGNFNQMAQAMIIDPALMFWLDAGANVKQSPNENLARELMELFVLGVGRYTEDDVRGVSRSLTGYNVADQLQPLPSIQIDTMPLHFRSSVRPVLGMRQALLNSWSLDQILRSSSLIGSGSA